MSYLKFILGMMMLAGLGSSASFAAEQDSREQGHKEVNLNSVKTKKVETADATKPKGPSEMRGEAFIVATEGKLSAEIKKTIAFYERSERTLPKKSSQRVVFLKRLVDLYLELAVYETNVEARNYDKAYSAWERAGAKGKSPVINNKDSKAIWAKVVIKASDVLKQFPNTTGADGLMFNQGYALQYLGKDKESAKAYTDLIQKYPNSDKAGDAYYQLGDFFFDKNNFRNATNNYKQALRFKGSRGYGWAFFKLGWCSYNLGNYPDALSYWKKTVALANASKQKGNDQLRDGGLRDMVFAWVEIKQVEEAINYYRQNGGEKYIGKFLSQLGSALVDAGKFAEAVRVYKRYQQLYPTAEDVPDTQKDVIGLYFDLNKFSEMWKELSAFPGMYGPTSSWYAANKGDQTVVDGVQIKIKDTVLYYAKVLHKAGQKDDDAAVYAEAIRGYLLFLKNYPNAKEMPEVKFNMADILFAQKKYQEAGKNYLTVVALGKEKAIQIIQPGNKVVSLHKDAARYMLDSYGLDFEPEYKVLLKLTPDFAKPARPLSPRASSYIQACSEYQKYYPEDKKSHKECTLYSTAIFYRTADKEKSRKLLFNVAQEYPNEKIGPEAVEWLIPLYSGETKALVQIADNLLKNPAYQKGKLGDKLRDLKRGAEIDEIKKIGDGGKRAKAFEDQALKHPSAPDANKLMYNAAVDYVKVGMIAAGIGAYAAVVKNYPKSDAYQESLLQLAKLSDKRLEFGAAASYYLAFAAKYPKEKSSVPAIGRACELQVAMGDEKALSTCMTLAKSDMEGAKLLVDRIVREAEYSKNYSKMQQVIVQAYIRLNPTPDERIIAFHRIFNAANGSGAAAQQASQEMLAAGRKAGGKVSAEAGRYLAELAFFNANAVMPKFAAMKLTGGTVDNLLATMQRKEAAIGTVDKSFEGVLATKDAFWGVAALYQMGVAREIMANDLENPPGITGAKIEDVKLQLAPKVLSTRGDAKKYFKFAVDSIAPFSVYNEWAGKSVSGLARRSGQNLSFEDVALMPDFIGSDVASMLVQAVQSKKAGE
jgi:tetratricopeptide (TPR) repeat protein